MNGMVSPRLIFLLLIAIFLVMLTASDACAANVGLQTSSVLELVSNRARMIQISCVFVAVGCALIWWYR